MKAVIVLRNILKGKEVKIGEYIHFISRKGEVFRHTKRNQEVVPSCITLEDFINKCKMISNSKIQKITRDDFYEEED